MHSTSLADYRERWSVYMEPLLISIMETGQTLGIGRSKTYELIQDGQLETVQIGKRRLVVKASVRALVERAASEMP